MAGQDLALAFGAQWHLWQNVFAPVPWSDFAKP